MKQVRFAPATVLAKGACVAAGFALVFAMSACSGSEDPTNEEGNTTAVKSPEEELGIKNPESVMNWLSDVACERNDEGVWTATGVIKNPTDSDARVMVRSAVIAKDTNGVQNAKQEVFTLSEGASEEFEFTAIHKSKSKKLDCVTRAVREGN